MKIEITIFASSSLEGRELEKTFVGEKLAQAITSLTVEKVGQRVDVEINSIHSGTPEYEFHKAVLYSDVVIFDGSLEEDGIALGENYACIPHAPYLMDNVIVVSRTELPINFIPMLIKQMYCPLEKKRRKNEKEIHRNTIPMKK